MDVQRQPRPSVALIALGSILWGSWIAWHYHRLGLTLTHYDARGHLVVARRIFDSITPGWQQIGAVWLPLPHLLNAIPVQVDAFYRTGSSGVAISILSFAATVAASAWIVHGLTGSLAAAMASAVVFGANPNVLYLQATPMTEPLLLALTSLSIALLIAWTDGAVTSSRLVGIAFALACLTRYEAWPVTAAALAFAAWALWRRGTPPRNAVASVSRIAAFPAVAIVAFGIFSRIVVGEWFVSSGFFVPENAALGHPVEAAAQIVWGVRALSGPLLVAAAAAGVVLLGAIGLFDRRRSSVLIVLAFFATASLPWAAFLRGHPYRIRYMVPLMAAEAIAAGFAAGFFRRPRGWLAAALVIAAAFELHPLDANAPMVVEAQWDRPNIAARQPVSGFLRAHYDGTTIMASMGSLGHYMQQLSHDGFAVRDFLHEGNGDIWLNAVDRPRPYVGWILIEEKAEGGDMLAELAREHPAFLEGYSRVAEGAGLALYRREPPAADQNLTLNVNR